MLNFLRKLSYDEWLELVNWCIKFDTNDDKFVHLYDGTIEKITINKMVDHDSEDEFLGIDVYFIYNEIPYVKYRREFKLTDYTMIDYRDSSKVFDHYFRVFMTKRFGISYTNELYNYRVREAILENERLLEYLKNDRSR